MHDQTSEILSRSIPWVIGVRTLIFFMIWVTLFLQNTRSRLGLWLNLFFFSTFLSSLSVFLYAWYSEPQIDLDETTSGYEYALFLSIDSLAIMTSLAGIMVAKHSRFIEETSDNT